MLVVKGNADGCGDDWACETTTMFQGLYAKNKGKSVIIIIMWKLGKDEDNK